MTFVPYDNPERYPEGNLAVYHAKVDEVSAEIDKIQFDLDLSDKVAALRETPGWRALVDRLQTAHDETLSPLTKNELSPYRQGWYQGRLGVIDVLLNTAPLTPVEIDSKRVQLTLLREQMTQIQEILR